MTPEIQASGTPQGLLSADAALPENRLLEHPIWAAALSGELPKARLKRLLIAFYPALAGPGRYAFAAKISQISPQDGKSLFMQLYDSLKKPEANADAGWAKVLVALGASAGGEVPAVAMTAFAAEADRARVIAAGFQVHLAKPVEVDTLLEAVARLASTPLAEAEHAPPEA